MPIQSGDIKLLASQVMDDIEQGGGAPTSTVIQDGASNSVFNDISELDRAAGRVNLRKLFASVQTDTTDTYLGGNVIVADMPDDPNVSVALFSTGDNFDRRGSAADRVEAYLNAGAEWPGYLFEDHIAGQRVIQIFARPGVSAPNVGRTIVLRENEGDPDQYEQYVRVIRTSAEDRTFSASVGGTIVDYQAQIITCDLSDALRYDFSGSPASRYFTADAAASKIRDTVVADAALYYGAASVTDPVALGDIKVKVGTVYSQLVPNAQTETALVDVRPAAGYEVAIASAPRAVSVGGSPFSQRIRVGQENRGYNYVTILKPIPAPGSVVVSYRALGNTYTLTDDGEGNMSGAGSGRVNYATGSISVTLQALPDDRSAVVFYWGQTTRYTNRAGTITVPPPRTSVLLPSAGVVDPASIAIAWTAGGVAKTATCNAACEVSGDATGRFYSTSGELMLTGFAVMPDPDTEFNATFDTLPTVVEPHAGLSPDTGGFVSITLEQQPEPGTVLVQWATTLVTSTTNGSKVDTSTATKSSNASTTVVTPYVVPGIIRG